MKIMDFVTEGRIGGTTPVHGFFCPGCRCAHWFNTVLWTWNGDMNKPTVNPSILVQAGNLPGDVRCHSYVLDGKIQFLGDCTHELKGQTVDIPEWESVSGESGAG